MYEGDPNKKERLAGYVAHMRTMVRNLCRKTLEQGIICILGSIGEMVLKLMLKKQMFNSIYLNWLREEPRSFEHDNGTAVFLNRRDKFS